VNCARFRQVFDAFVDHELDSGTVAEVDAHLVTCSTCSTLRAEREALGAAVRLHAPYYSAPAAVRQTVYRSLTRNAGNEDRRLSRRMAGAVALAAGIVGLVLGFLLGRPATDDPLRDQVVASHVASLAPGRGLTHIASADRHAIKPWFAGQIDFAPTVRDLSHEGFMLVGARLDHIGDRQAAAVVYRVRNHYVNLFIWPAARDQPEALSTSTVRGFGFAAWAQGGLRFAAISDVDRRDLERFAQLASAL
jgi:anti-sigma factor RsiW